MSYELRAGVGVGERRRELGVGVSRGVILIAELLGVRVKEVC
jgi:hypothetical protein